jgi:hypothetical protein
MPFNAALHDRGSHLHVVVVIVRRQFDEAAVGEPGVKQTQELSCDKTTFAVAPLGPRIWEIHVKDRDALIRHRIARKLSRIRFDKPNVC